MNAQPDLFQNLFHGSRSPHQKGREVMNGKPVFTRAAKSVINFESNFAHKLLCDGPTFSAGDACVYSCSFCYVPDLMRKLRAIPQMAHIKGDHSDIVVRRGSAADIARRQLTDARGRPRFLRTADNQEPLSNLYGPAVCYASPLVDVAGNMELVRETIDICSTILELTRWQIRLLSKSTLLPKVAEGMSLLTSAATVKERMIFGVSTGTLDDSVAKAFEQGTPLVSKRIQSLHWLQDNGFRTYGMICPSLPQTDYGRFAREMAAAIRADRCEHVWAEVINVRGESFIRTMAALRSAGLYADADRLQGVMRDKNSWERYARETFEAHAAVYGGGALGESVPPKLRFLQYVTPSSRNWWADQAERGAVLL